MPTIKVDPSVLMGQSAEMLSLTEDYDRLFRSVSSSLNTMNTRWSTNLSNNFAPKIISAGNSFDILTGLLREGAASAKISATQFVEIDQVLGASAIGGALIGAKKVVSWLHDHLRKKKPNHSGSGHTIAEETKQVGEQVTDAVNTVPVKTETETVINDYSGNVTKGQIRWVNQTGDVTTNANNGWGKYNNRDYGWYGGSPNSQCNSACESMALSYLGIDRPPESLVPDNGSTLDGLEVANYGTDTRTWTAPDGSTIQIDNHANCDMADIDARVNHYMQDCNQGDVAPVMVRYQTSDGRNGHWLIITGKNADGSYNVIGPGGEKERGTTVTIDQYGNISGGSISHGGGTIHRYAQYSRQS